MDEFHPLSLSDEEEIWRQVNSTLDFRPDYYERRKPAIREPSPFVTYSLVDITPDEPDGSVTALLLDAFRGVTQESESLFSLDWQHQCYRYQPHRVGDLGSCGWYPNGDYYFHVARDVSFGTFGHPWQESLCVIGGQLLERVHEELKQRFPVLRSSI